MVVKRTKHEVEVRCCIPDETTLITLLPTNNKNWCWDRMTVEGHNPHSPVFIDHGAIKKRYEKALQLYHMWD